MVVPPCESTKCHSVVDFEMVHLTLCDLYFHFQNEQTKKASRRKPGVNFVSLPSALYIFAWCQMLWCCLPGQGTKMQTQLSILLLIIYVVLSSSCLSLGLSLLIWKIRTLTDSDFTQRPFQVSCWDLEGRNGDDIHWAEGGTFWVSFEPFSPPLVESSDF